VFDNFVGIYKKHFKYVNRILFFFPLIFSSLLCYSLADEKFNPDENEIQARQLNIDTALLVLLHRVAKRVLSIFN
jgi:hypothetical protein